MFLTFHNIIENVQSRLLFANLKKFVGAFEGIFRPLEIGRHLGGRLSSPGVSELLVAWAGEETKGNQREVPRASTAVARAQPARDGKERTT